MAFYVGALGSPVNIDDSNLANYFSNNNSDFSWNSTNQRFETPQTTIVTAQYSLTATSNISSLTVDCGLSLGGIFGIFYIDYTPVNGSSSRLTTFDQTGTDSLTITNLKEGDKLDFTFSKTNNDTSTYCWYSMQFSVPDNTARKISKLYVGVETEIPTYETQTVTVTNSNVDNLFTVSHTSGGGFPWKSSNSRFQAGAGPSGTTNFTTTWTAKQDIDSLTFTYRLSKSSNTNTSYYFRIKKNGTQVVNATSSVSGATYTFTDLKKNDVITFTFTKSSSNTSYYAYFTASGTIKTQTGSTTQEVARLVEKLYVGVNGVARRVL